MSRALYDAKTVAAWFHTRGVDGWTPALTLRDVMDLCLGALRARDFRLTVTDLTMRRLCCQALCVLYQGSPRGRALAFQRPLRPPFPPDWTEEHEALWRVLLDMELPAWEDVLSEVPVCAWEMDLPGWRDTLTSLFRHYLVREERLLIAMGLLFEEEEGEDDG